MSLRTKLFSVHPWPGGVNTSQDPAMIRPDQLTKADNIIMGVDLSKQRRPGINCDWDDATSASNAVVGLHDFWFGSSGKTQRLVGLNDNKTFYLYQIDGTRSTITDNGTPYPQAVTTASMLTFTNRAIVAVDGLGNTLKQLDARAGVPTQVLDLGRAEVTTITCDAQASANYDGTYFDIATPTVDYRVWFNLDSGSSAPAAGGRTLVEVAVSSGDSANDVALAIETALEAITGSVFSVEVASADAVVTNTNPGSVVDADDSAGPGGAFAAVVTTQGISAPNAYAIAEHIGRIFASDKDNVDLLHFCQTSNPELWKGFGDSGALLIRPGDGDPEGITAIAPYKGDLIVFKSSKIYRLIGTAPETMIIQQVSDSIGCVGPEAVADVDGNDLIFVSKRGVHSLNATDQFGDIRSTYISKDIQRTYNDRWTKSRRKYIKAKYLPSENSVAFGVTDKDFSNTTNKAIWFYNTSGQAWYRWPNVVSSSLALVDEVDRDRLFIGSNDNRVCRSLTSSYSDFNTVGSETGVSYELSTGFIDVEGSPYVTKMFKNIALIYRAQGTYTLTVKIRIDNFAEQTVTFSDADPGDLLGVDFILGSSALGVDNALTAHVREIQGMGKYIRIRVLMSGSSEQIDLQGFMVEYEVADDQKEVIDASA